MTKTILVADDQPGIRMLLKEVFSEKDYDVTTAETGQDALDYLYGSSYDLLILDYKLPVVDGADLLKRLDADQVDLPTIIMSGLTENISEEIKQLSAVREVFAKPFDIQEISDSVSSILA
ncbi:sporulation initiation phosphotransferase Spo0F [Barrientosiimonas marina]|uniref:Response regulator n=1 Tax=Lentibacillus kimchii TaxID=1542911 RepID=A0ABW2UV98_9BACI